MLVDPIKHVNGVEDTTGYSVPVNAKTIRGFQCNPFVLTDDQCLDRETYEIQTMIDPGDPDKKREIYHMFPGSYEFTSDVYANIPKGHIGYLTTPKNILAAGCSIVSTILEPESKGLVNGQFIVNGGEAFIQPGSDIAELIIVKIGE